MKDSLYIIDIKFKQKNFNILTYLNEQSDEIISLTPYSNYLLDKVNKKYITFHNICSVDIFHDKIINQYQECEQLFADHKELGFLFRYFAFIITYDEYIKQLKNYLLSKKEKFKIYYITDLSVDSNTKNNLFQVEEIDEYIYINNKDRYFYLINTFTKNYNIIKNKNNLFVRLFNKYIKKTQLLSYDNVHFENYFQAIKSVKIKEKIDNSFLDDFISILDQKIKHKSTYDKYISIIDNLKSKISIVNKDIVRIKPFSYLCDEIIFLESILYKKNNIPRIFMQHGSYFYSHFFFKYNEVYPASINFVLNDYTKNEFKKYGFSKVKVIESINFNYPINKLVEKFDYLYITHCTTYGDNATYIDGLQSYYSMDANNIFQRHKEIIELFGNKFQDKKICIKIQPGIFTGTMLYVPFLELSKKFENVTIEFSLPIQKLISKSKYIISDYFSSEFINRELHYKKDIILFNSDPLVLPEETVEDMKKMFILVDTVDDLEEKVKNIKELTKDRKRYDDIIEYYSSKKCDTKKVVTEILEKELNART